MLEGRALEHVERVCWIYSPVAGSMTVATRLTELAGKPAALGVLTDRRLVLGDVDAVDLVVGDVALLPRGPAAPSRPGRALDLPEMACSSSADSWPAPGSSRSMTYFGIVCLLVRRLWLTDAGSVGVGAAVAGIGGNDPSRGRGQAWVLLPISPLS